MCQNMNIWEVWAVLDLQHISKSKIISKIKNEKSALKQTEK